MKFKVTTTAQVKRSYDVEADTIEQAHKRLRAFISDKGMVVDGIISRTGEYDSTPERITDKALRERDGAPEPLAAD